jgi:secondary thiamine-phosphate synthase enzyme
VRGLHDVTTRIADVVARSQVGTGLCHVFVRHTSASLVIQENADPSVRRDLDAFFARLVPDGDPLFTHVEEGPDDMSAHVRGALTAVSLTVPVSEGHLGLGTWQGIFLWEHRTHPHQRRLVITVQGCP